MNKQAKKTVKISHFLPLIFIGLGLIVLGLVAAKLIADDGFATEYSVIPSEVNYPAPELTLMNLNGDKVNISDFRQNVVLVNNWATWCPPCKAEMPTLLKYYKDHADQGFVLLGINAGDPVDDVTNFVDELGLTFPILLDPNNRSMIAFQNSNLPSSYVIDPNGDVILAWTGPINKQMLDKYVTPLLEQ